MLARVHHIIAFSRSERLTTCAPKLPRHLLPLCGGTKHTHAQNGKRPDQPAVAASGDRAVGSDRAVPLLFYPGDPGAAGLARADAPARGRRREDTADVPAGRPADGAVGSAADGGQHRDYDGEDTFGEGGECTCLVYYPQVIQGDLSREMS